MKAFIFTTSFLSLLFLVSCGGDETYIDDPLVKVFKYDSSIQCESEGIALDTMQLELTNAGIEVDCAQKGHDGLARIQACGTDTGNINIYQISTDNLNAAEALEFMRTESLSEYRDSECTQQ